MSHIVICTVLMQVGIEVPLWYIIFSAIYIVVKLIALGYEIKN